MPELVFTRLPVANAPISATFRQDFGRGPHRGIDFAVTVGAPVVAPAGGLVVPFANYGNFGGYGAFGLGVCIEHDGTGWYSLYAHLRQRNVEIGDRVKTGDLLGLSGNTGDSTGPHLHWQVCRSTQFPVDISQSADPLSFYHPDQAPEEEEMDAAFRGLFNIAFGDYQRMRDCYRVLAENGFVPVDVVAEHDLNEALSYRFAIAALCTADNRAEAYRALGG